LERLLPELDREPHLQRRRRDGGSGRIAAAWGDLNPGSRAAGFLDTFPLQALGWGQPLQSALDQRAGGGGEAAGTRSTFAISLFDDGTGIDEQLEDRRGEPGPDDPAATGLAQVGPAGRWHRDFDLRARATTRS
jgi:hypothetical protein